MTKEAPVAPHHKDAKKAQISRSAERLIGIGLAVIGVLVVISFFWSNHSTIPTPQEPTPQQPTPIETSSPATQRFVPSDENSNARPRPKVTQDRMTSIDRPIPRVRVIPPCAQGQPIEHPFTGEEIEPSEPMEGKSTLLVRNGTGYDAFVRLVDSLTGAVAKSAYVQAGDVYRLFGIEPGSYRLTFATGFDWVSTCMDFIRDASYSEFEEPLVFRFSTSEDEESISTYVTNGEVTLNPVVGGNARIRRIDRESFYRGDQNFTLAP